MKDSKKEGWKLNSYGLLLRLVENATRIQLFSKMNKLYPLCIKKNEV